MATPLRVLHVEDSQEDADVISLWLRRGGFDLLSQRVQTAQAMRAALSAGSWDLILADCTLPENFTALDALQIAGQMAPELPILVVSGTIGEERAAAVVKAGATDFVLKGNLSRLLPAVERTLREAEERRERRRAEQAARELADIVGSSADAILSTSLEGVITSWNPAAERLFGWAALEAVGRPLSLVVPPERREEVRKVLDRLGEDGPAELVDAVLVRKDGIRVDVSLSVSPIRDAEGRVVAAAQFVRDVSAQRQSSEAQALLAAIVESSEDAIVSADPDGIILSWNPAAERLFGYRAAEAVGRSNFQLLVPPDLLGESRDRVERVRKGERLGPLETLRLRKGGEKVYVSVSVSAVRVEGRVIGLSAVYRDITARRLLEEQYRQSQKMEAVGRLAGGIAHDFNNLLTIINGYGEIVIGRLPAGDPARELVGEIKAAGERAALLTRQLLAFGRQAVLAPTVLDLNAVVADLEKMLRRVIGEDIRLSISLEPYLGRVRADAGQIDQVLLNLAVNARDAMPTGGQLTIETRNVELDEGYTRTHAEVSPGRYVLLAVSDTGHGMTEEVKARIFEPFFTTKEKGKGTGLGLATVFGIVKQSGGSVEVYSEVGLGTTFKVYLPRVSEEVPAPRKSHQGLAPAPGGNETVLLVEDEDAVRALTRVVLQNGGYTVLEAADGAQALRVAQGHAGPIQLLLSDVVMPYLGGRELAEKLLALHPEMKVLFLSGYTDDAVVRHGVLHQEVNFLQKPFSTAVLALKVREVLDG